MTQETQKTQEKPRETREPHPTPPTADKSDLMALAQAMNNLADALRETNQLARDMQLINPKPEEMGLLQAINELTQRVAVLSTRIR